MNYFSSNRTWRHSDIESTHRIGQVHKTSRHRLCPLIVTFSHGNDKLSFLRDSRLREELRKNGIKVAADLTPRQRDQLQHYKERGKVAYYKNGRPHVENRRRDYTDSHPQRQAAHKNDEIDYIHGERESSRMPKVKIIATKKEPVTNTTLIPKTGTVDGTRKTDVVDFMIQTHSTSTYPTIPEGIGMELRNTEINISVKP